MTRNQEEQLDELADHIAQAKTILTDLAESIETVGSDENPDDEVEPGKLRTRSMPCLTPLMSLRAAWTTSVRPSRASLGSPLSADGDF